ncbi:MAG TPA: S1 RNA-binding domain-containing protein [Aggregatilineales bacterium]|nr:S1 RNA-binding domain-containing protein [Anaerolineales bacterium]HRE46371.1 S1 RNA-binding domain-containing protein [Aggregatilineales bacterium]
MTAEHDVPTPVDTELSAPVAEAAPEVTREAVVEMPLATAAETTTETTTQTVAEPLTETTSVSPLAELKTKAKLQGKVTRLELFGAFVDVGVGVDGLVHISQIREEPVKNVNDALTVGQEVTVWVRKVDTNAERLDLTMIEMPGLLWNELAIGQTYSGTVVRLEKFGAFVDIGAERPGMVHVSELASGYVSSPEEIVKVGDTVTAKVIKLNKGKKQIDLSLKALEEKIEMPVEETPSEKPLSAFEIALRRAMAKTDDAFPEVEKALANVAAGSKQDKRKRENKRSANEKLRQQQEEIFKRTLTTSGKK